MYTVVDVGATVILPTSVVVLKEPGVIVIDVALAAFHESVVVPAGRIYEGEAENAMIAVDEKVFSCPMVKNVAGFDSLLYSV